MKTYPDATHVLKKKAARRKRQANLSFEEKITIVNKWRKLAKRIQKNQSSAEPAQAHQPNLPKGSG
jgi:hypothetical protein